MSVQPAPPGTALIVANARDLICPSLPYPSYLSPPFPMTRKRTLATAFIVGRGEVTSEGGGYELWPPSLVVYFDARDGRFEGLLAVVPSHFGFKEPVDQPFHRGMAPTEALQPEFLEQRLRLYNAMDRAIDALLDGKSDRELLSHVDRLFREQAEPPLHRYYEKTTLRAILGTPTV